MTKSHGLTQETLSTITSILEPYAQDIDKVCLFGSRAMGTYRPNSDIDMVLYGSVSPKQHDRIRTLFDESNLYLPVDVHVYDTVSHSPLKEHIDRYGQPLSLTCGDGNALL